MSVTAPLVAPLLTTSETGAQIVSPGTFDGNQVWFSGAPNNYSLYASQTATHIMAQPPTRRVLYFSNFGQPEIRAPSVGTMDSAAADAALLAGRITPGITKSACNALAGDLIAAGCERLEWILLDVETGVDLLMNALAARAPLGSNAGVDDARRRAIKDMGFGVGTGLINLTASDITGGGYFFSANGWAAGTLLAQHAALLVNNFVRECTAMLQLLGPVYVTMGDTGGGCPAWSLKSSAGSFFPAMPIPAPLNNCLQTFLTGAQADQMGQTGHEPWASFLMYLDALRGNMASGRPPMPIFATTAYNSRSIGKCTEFMKHAVRTVGLPRITPIWNDGASGAGVQAQATALASACAGDVSLLVNPGPIDFPNTTSLTTGAITTTRAGYEAL